MNVTQTAGSLAAPYQLLSCIHLYRIAAQTPAGELHADVAQHRLLCQLVGYPCGGQPAVVAPLRQLVVVTAEEGFLWVIASLGRLYLYAANLLGV